MASARQTIGDKLGVAVRSIKRRLINAFLAARPVPTARLTAEERDAVMLKVWQGVAAGLVPISPDGSVTIGTQNDANGDAQLTLQALGGADLSGIGKAPFALYQFWRGPSYGHKDVSGNQRDLTVVGTATYSDTISSGQGIVVGDTYLKYSTVPSPFQDLGDRAVCIVFQLTSLPAEGTRATLFNVDGDGGGVNNSPWKVLIEPSGALTVAYEYSESDTSVTWSPEGVALQTGVLYHLVVSRKSNVVTLYLQGVQVGQQSMPPGPDGGTNAQLFIGGFGWYSSTYRMDGIISSAAFYAEDLTADDVRLLWRDEVFRWGSRASMLAHASTHAPGGSDPIQEGSLTQKGLLQLGTTAGTACAGDDVRLLGARPFMGFLVSARHNATDSFVSRDGGVTWKAGGVLPENTPWFGVIWDPYHAHFIAIAGSGKTAYSVDGGASWVAGADANVSYAMGYDPVNHTIFSVPTNGGAAKYSTDGGVTWNSSASSIPNVAWYIPAYDVAHGKCVCVADGTNKVLISADGGVTWAQSSGNLPFTGSVGILWDPDNSRLVAFPSYAANDRRVAFSTDGGSTWTASGANALAVVNSWFAVAHDPIHHRLVIHSNATTNTYYSTDGGASWVAGGAIDSGNVTSRSMHYLPSTGRIITFAYDGASAYYSDTGGASWVKITPSPAATFGLVAGVAYP